LEEGDPAWRTLAAGLLCNEADWRPPGEDEEEAVSDGDPLEVALLAAGASAGLDRAGLQERFERTDAVPFSSERRYAASMHRDPDGGEEPLVFCKGAPETIIGMCATRAGADGDVEIDADALKECVDDLAGEGLRLLAMCEARGDAAAEAVRDGELSDGRLLGFQGLMDPPRQEAADAVDACHDAGIRVVMVTGDHARTAGAIAGMIRIDRKPRFAEEREQVLAESHRERKKQDGVEEEDEQQQTERPQDREAETDDAADRRGEEDSARDGDAGQANGAEVITGDQLADMDDAEFDRVCRRVDVFARSRPDQKLRLVKRLKEKDEIVAVTGDGVNDAPALKAAHLGVAMGETGTDVAKQASAMVLTDDNFATIEGAIEEGRTAFRNIRMATFFLLSTGLAEVITILCSFAVGWPLPFVPAQILWLNVVTNGIEDVALAFEPGEKDLLERPPRPPTEGVLSRLLIERTMIVGLWLAVGTLGLFAWEYLPDGDTAYARVAALTLLVCFQVVHVFNCRSEFGSLFRSNPLRNKILFFGAAISLGIHIAALYLPWTQQLLDLQPLTWQTWGIIAAAALTVIPINEAHKALRKPAWVRHRPAGAGAAA
ncbi:MAG: cation-translocating P-type ATPase, partial [Planctomycetota bacterium]